MKIKNLLLGITLSASISVFFSSCDTNSGSTDPEPETAKQHLMLITTDEANSSGILASFDKMPDGNIDVSKLTNIVQLGATREGGVVYNGAYYHTANTAGQSGIQKFTVDATGRITTGGFLPSGEQYTTGNNFGFATKTKGYYTNSDLSQTAIQIFNPETMARTGQIDLTTEINAIKANLKDVLAISIGGFMIERDGKFFTEIFFLGTGGNQVVDKSYVAVIDVATDKLDKIIVWDDFLTFGYGLKNTNYINTDAAGNIYLASFIGNFNDTEGPNFRVVRIKKGETDFDKTWNVNSLKDFSTENMALGGQILDGKMYLKMFSNKIDLTFAGMAEKKYDSYVLDISTKKLTKITDIPSAYWKSIHGPEIYNSKPYFIVEDQEPAQQTAEGKKAYYYSYDPATGKSTKVITVIGGQPQGIYKL